jgi:hypothetical protein
VGLWLSLIFTSEALCSAVVALVAHSSLRIDVARGAGAGSASLRHILERAPVFVKPDIGMVRDVDKDPSRAATVGGLCHFAEGEPAPVASRKACRIERKPDAFGISA